MPAIHRELRKALLVEEIALEIVVGLKKDVQQAKSTPKRLAVSRALNEAIDTWRKVHETLVEIRGRVSPHANLRTKELRERLESGAADGNARELAPDDDPAAADPTPGEPEPGLEPGGEAGSGA